MKKKLKEKKKKEKQTRTYTMNLRKLQETVKDREAWCAVVH